MSQTVYVSTTGSNRNPGTIDQPFRTIEQAIRSLPMGQGGTVLIRGGEYVLDDAILISDNIGGKPDSRLVVSNYAGEKVRINGTKLAPQKSGAFIVSSTSAVDIQGLEIFGSDTGISVVGAAQDVRILNNIVHDTQLTGIAAYGAELGSVKNVVVDGNIVYRTNLFNADRPIVQPGGWGMGITFSRTEGGSITNNTVYENYGEGIGFTLADGAIASNNVVYDNYSVQMYMDHATNSVFDRNLVFNTGNRSFYRPYATGEEVAAVGIQLANERYRDANPIRNNTIRNNIVVGGSNVFGYGAYDVGGGLKNVLVANNTFYGDNSTRSVLAIDADAHENSSFVNNIFAKTDVSQFAKVPSLKGLGFANNLWSGGTGGTIASSTDINADPQFFYPGGLRAEDYQIRVTSPARDRGMGYQTNSPASQPQVLRPSNWTTDLNGDGTGDVLWHNARSGDLVSWEMGANLIQGGQSFGVVSPTWALRGLIDLNGDKQAEALWHNQQTGDVGSWQFVNGAFQSSAIAQVNPQEWQMIGFGEFNNDGKGDLLWRNLRTQDVGVWLMDGGRIGSAMMPRRLSDRSWQVKGMADFNGDRKTDVLWWNPQTNSTEIWVMDGVNVIDFEILPGRSTPLWEIVGVNDFNGDNKADLLWQNRQTGKVDLWEMDGVNVQNRRTLLESGAPGWEVVAAQDFVGGAAADIFWYNRQNGVTLLWEIENGQIKRNEVLLNVGDRNWQPEATKDFTGDGKADVFWRNQVNGSVGLWRIGINSETDRYSLAASVASPGTVTDWRGAF
jgi:hypothetical protein